MVVGAAAPPSLARSRSQSPRGLSLNRATMELENQPRLSSPRLAHLTSPQAPRPARSRIPLVRLDAGS